MRGPLEFRIFKSFELKKIFWCDDPESNFLFNDKSDENLPKIKFTSSDGGAISQEESEDLVDIERFSKVPKRKVSRNPMHLMRKMSITVMNTVKYQKSTNFVKMITSKDNGFDRVS